MGGVGTIQNMVCFLRASPMRFLFSVKTKSPPLLLNIMPFGGKKYGVVRSLGNNFFFSFVGALNGILPTKLNLANRKIQVDRWCLSCGSDVESIVHGLFLCHCTLKIWRNILPSIGYKLGQMASACNLFMDALIGVF